MTKRFWRIMALALAAVLTGCGAGGQDFHVQEQDTQSVQEAQDNQEVQDAQVAQDAQATRGTQDTQGTQDARDEYGVQDKQEARSTQEPQEAQASGTVEEQIRAEMTDEQKNWMGGLDEEKRLKDFKSLCDGLRDRAGYRLPGRGKRAGNLPEIYRVNGMTGSARDIENGEKIQYNTGDKFSKSGSCLLGGVL